MIIMLTLTQKITIKWNAAGSGGIIPLNPPNKILLRVIFETFDNRAFTDVHIPTNNCRP